MAAVLACGPGAALSHTSAGALWDIRRSDAVRIDVTVPTDAGRKPRAGLTVHRARRLRPDEVTTHHGIPVTTAARTLLDLAGKLSERRLHRALDQAEIERLTDYPSLDALARAHPGHKGAGKLRRAVRVHTAGTTLTRSELEELFLKLCRRHGLPQPQVNEYVGEFLVDFVFAPDRLVIETDSWRYHRTRQAFERDRRRDWTLARAGYRTLRFTDRQLVDEPREVAQALLAALRQGGAA
jgi:very-short-patch-repair endonuclease